MDHPLESLLKHTRPPMARRLSNDTYSNDPFMTNITLDEETTKQMAEITEQILREMPKITHKKLRNELPVSHQIIQGGGILNMLEKSKHNFFD